MKPSKVWTAKDAAKCIIVPSDLDHKYSRGVLGLITGSAQFPGAAVLTTSAAYATGLGMARFHSSSGLAHLVLHQSPETVVQPGPVTAWLAGSGIHHKKYSDFTTFLRHRWFILLKRQSVPTILDAGALHLAGKLNQPTLITPHAGELSRLFARHGITVSSEVIESDPTTWAKKCSQLLKVTVLLKGSRTVVAQGDLVISLPEATSYLATAGTGDVLAGIIGALVATNYIEILNSQERLAHVAATGAFIHNQAAQLASKGAPISASQISLQIQEVIRKLLK
jgi:NAD(P)H-hydrate repair Nnr-like enzyme with NAD(P)H-hydrate dehydratase domain